MGRQIENLFINARSLLLFVFCCSLCTNIHAQNIPVKLTETGAGVFLGEIRPLRDIPELSAKKVKMLKAKAEAKDLNKKKSVYDHTRLPVLLYKRG